MQALNTDRGDIILMSSAAGLALALLIAGPGGHLAHTMPAWSSDVRAARIAAQHGAKVAKAAEATQPAADFAGLALKCGRAFFCEP